MMFIETALKNIALNTIMTEIDSSSVYDMYDKAISSYKNAPAGTREDIKKKYQNNKLNLQGSIQNAIAAAYRKENPKITHFYNNVVFCTFFINQSLFICGEVKEFLDILRIFQNLFNLS